MVSTPSPPPPPDPVATANAQGAMNKETAITQGELNSTNQVTPYGNLTYTQGGNWADGTPQFTATTTLSPDQQKLLDLGTQTQKTLGQLGVDQSSKVSNILNSPFDLNAATGTQQADISKTLLDPVWNQRQASLQTQLANQGITEGSDAYTNAMRDFGMQRDNSYNSALLADRGQASQEALTNRNQPLNEITALMSGSQVSQPNFTNTPSESIASPDLIGATYNSANLAQQNYNTKMQNQNAMMGGLFGLGGAGIGAAGTAMKAAPTVMMFSDEDLKENIKEVGETDTGLPLYQYNYRGQPESDKQIGLIAQDVEKVMPDAVRKFAGYRAVNYDKALGLS